MAVRQVIICSGASRGIGRGIASSLARDSGNIVYATARSEESLQSLAAEIGPALIPVQVDHSNDSSVRSLVERVILEQGRLDAVVNNAYGGVGPLADHFGKRFWEKPLSIWDASHDVGLRSHYVLSSLAVPAMLQSGTGGLLVNISSAGGMGYLFDVAYGTGKQALDRMTLDMAVELQGTGVRAVTLWPGPVNTESTAFPDSESVEFSGRAIAALLNSADPAYLDSINGKIVQTSELSAKFGFGDTLGGKGSSAVAIKRAQARRTMLETQGPVHWRLDADLPDMSSFQLAKNFEAAKSGKKKTPGQMAKL